MSLLVISSREGSYWLAALTPPEGIALDTRSQAWLLSSGAGKGMKGPRANGCSLATTTWLCQRHEGAGPANGAEKRLLTVQSLS